jgi:hypothetical protein
VGEGVMKISSEAEAVHAFTIPVFVHALKALYRILERAEAHARQHKIELEALVQARLYPNMFTLLQQVQYACFLPVDFARHFSAREAPRVGYDEKTLAELKRSIKTTIAYLKAIRPKNFRDKEEVLLPVFFDDKSGLRPRDHAARIAVPDFFFHVTTAYCILRHNGVPLSKGDYLGPHGAEKIKKSGK